MPAGGAGVADGFISPVDLVEIGLASAEEAERLHAHENGRCGQPELTKAAQLTRRHDVFAHAESHDAPAAAPNPGAPRRSRRNRVTARHRIAAPRWMKPTTKPRQRPPSPSSLR
jgi:hypothetical protein